MTLEQEIKKEKSMNKPSGLNSRMTDGSDEKIIIKRSDLPGQYQ